MLKLNGISKEYIKGEIGGKTLREELNNLRKKFFHKKNKNPEITIKTKSKNEKFLAVDNISFEVKSGERIGIIGHNGAGKSTLLKLISRVTSPTKGEIGLNGRVSSMLEIGTGFHPELTGRENIYMNGAILGMSKKEIDTKIESIIEFSELREFIDTPVKRYSSGMYVKLAFAVMAHLDSEIMIMDEVLAVGDMDFQRKCIDKMNQVSLEKGRTILYVSHNMETIRSLCNRCIVLEKGKIIYDGEVENAINLYLSGLRKQSKKTIDCENIERNSICTNKAVIKRIELLNSDSWVINRGEKLSCEMKWKLNEKIEGLKFALTVNTIGGLAIGTSFSYVVEDANINSENTFKFSFDTTELAKGAYCISLMLLREDVYKNLIVIDELPRLFTLEIVDDNKMDDSFNNWGNRKFGLTHLKALK
ncbi:MAG: ATP-binding cassette domain-containing protein, partial [Firmicutes bacterium]|nr:ATP-binding cassette domain-containing protein [Candidatus Caballimonas caccae]